MRRQGWMVALALIAATTACTGHAAPPRGEGSPTSAESGPPTRLPAGQLTTLSRFRGSQVAGGTEVRTSVASTDDYAVASTGSSHLRVLDRESGTQLWAHDLDLVDGWGACPLPQLAPTATSVTVLVGFTCNRIQTYDLATGEELEDRLANEDVPAMDDDVTGYGLSGGSTYWIDEYGVSVVGDDGISRRVLTNDDLGLHDDFATITRASVSTDHQLAVVLADPHPTTGRFGDDSGDVYIGVALDGDRSRVLWTVKQRDLDFGFPVRHPYLRSTPGTLMTAQRSDDRWVLAVFDPETGNLRDRQLVLPPLKQGGYPGLLTQEHHDDFLIIGDTLVTSLAQRGDRGFAHVASYDLAAHRRTWAELARLRGSGKPGETGCDVVPTGLAADGQHLYGSVYLGRSPYVHLFEMDAATGETTGTWETPGDTSTYAAYAIGDRVLTLDRFVLGKRDSELYLSRPVP